MTRSFNNRVLRVLVPLLIIVGSFYLGIFLYLQALTAEIPKKVPVTNFSAKIKSGVSKGLELRAGDRIIKVGREELEKWVEEYRRDYSEKQDLRISSPKIGEYIQSLASHLDIEPVNAKFKFQNNRAEIFIPSTQGKKLNIAQLMAQINSGIIENKDSITLVFDTIEPEITLEKVNSLGIKTLIGRGESDYGKSSASRIHNIKIGMSKFNGVMLKPGEEFSFNSLLGAVDEKDGYQAELVIKNGQLVREYGGGLCQVSTTVFRAAILTGLPIVERRPHSFPVQYYNPQGFDATIYPGSTDLKFTNDTSGHILIQTRLVKSKLLVEIYGSDDGKKVEIDGPFQYAQKANGAMKAYFTRKILRGNELVKEERFDSNYRPPPRSPLERNPLE